MPRTTALLAALLAAATVSAQEGVRPDSRQYSGDPSSSQNPYIVAGDRAYSRRQEGRVGDRASPRLIAEAIAAYQTAQEAPDNLEARWKLLRALYFKGVYTGLDAESRRAVFAKGRLVSDDAIGILARRAGLSAAELSELGSGSRAEALSGQREAAATFFWSAVNWGQWALMVGKLQAAKAGAAERIRNDAMTVILLDPQYEDGGGYRVLGRLHDQAPQIPFLTGWVSREEALRNLRLAYSVSKANFVNRHFLAEALARGGSEERAEAVRLEEGLVADSPSPGHLVEDLVIQEQARANLEAWKKAASAGPAHPADPRPAR
jgi:hypothetical protein